MFSGFVVWILCSVCSGCHHKRVSLRWHGSVVDSKQKGNQGFYPRGTNRGFLFERVQLLQCWCVVNAWVCQDVGCFAKFSKNVGVNAILV